MSVRSMTGFARVRKASPAREFTVSVKSVNHRGLDVHFQMPPELDPYEEAMRRLVKEQVARGHVEVRVAATKLRQEEAVALNRPLLAAYVASFREAAREFGLRGEPDLNAALSIPGMLAGGAEIALEDESREVLLEALREALQEMNRFREREGVEIARAVLGQKEAVEAALRSIQEIRSGAVAALQQRLAKRLSELLEGADLEPQRLAQEAAFLADRSDISEELTRLEIHAREVEEVIRRGGEVGKKLDFLFQEMNRETNTVLAKANSIGEAGLEITALALAVKSAIEKMREQSLNLE